MCATFKSKAITAADSNNLSDDMHKKYFVKSIRQDDYFEDHHFASGLEFRLQKLTKQVFFFLK